MPRAARTPVRQFLRPDAAGLRGNPLIRSTAAPVLLLVVALAAPCRVLPAQTRAPPLQWEGRLDAFTGDAWAIQAGAGISAPLGTYVRFGAVGGIGPGAEGLTGRTDLIVRFTLDPFRDKRWAPYGVGGVSARYGGRPRTSMVLMAGVEGPPMGRVAPAIEAGFGGSFRLGLALRQAFARRR